MKTRVLLLTAAVFFFGFFSAYAASTWAEPASAPPLGNTDTPVRTGSETQIKSGALEVQGLFTTQSQTSLGLDSAVGNVGIGTLAPAYKLDVVGSANATQLCIAGVCQASWAGLGGQDTKWVISGANMYATTSVTNVGVGTITPARKLHVVGITRFEQNGQNSELVGTDHVYQALYPQGFAAGRFAWIGYGSVGTNVLTVMNQRADLLQLGTNNAVRLTVAANGNVGIGKVNPASLLDVNGTTSVPILCLAGDCRSAWPSSSGGTIGGSGTQNYLAKFTNSSTIGNSIIFDNGNVGIGTTSPAYAVDASGTVRIFRPGGPASPGLILKTISVGAFSSPGIVFEDGQAAPQTVTLRKLGNVMQFRSSMASQDIAAISAAATSSTYFNYGNFGIGITAPNAKMEVYSQADAILQLTRESGGSSTFRMGTDGALVVNNAGVDVLTLKNGNVGIGTTSPTRKLQVNGNVLVVSDPGYIALGNGNPYASLYFDAASGQLGLGANLHFDGTNWVYGNVAGYGGRGMSWRLFPSQRASLLYAGNGSNPAVIQELFTVLPNGNVGIGNPNPAYKLDVNGTTSVPVLCLAGDCRSAWPTAGGGGTISGSGAQNYLARFINSSTIGSSAIFDNGNIGIGTGAPAYKLDVVGTVQGQQYLSDAANIETVAGTYTPGASGGKLVYGFNEARGWGYNSADDAVYYQSYNSVQFVIRSGGDTGIGTTAPARKLHVGGIARIEANGQNTEFVGTDHVYQAFYPQGFAGGRFGYFGYGSIGTDQMTIMNSRPGNLAFGASSTIHMILNPSGNLGLGTSGPGARMEIYSVNNDNLLRLTRQGGSVATIRGGTDGALVISNAGSDAITIKNGNVGINNVDPQYSLHVRNGGIVSDLPGGHPWGMGVKLSAAGASAWGRQFAIFNDDVSTATSGALAAFAAFGPNGASATRVFIGEGWRRDGTNGTEWLSIIPSSRFVGIGTTATAPPLEKLHVADGSLYLGPNFHDGTYGRAIKIGWEGDPDVHHSIQTTVSQGGAASNGMRFYVHGGGAADNQVLTLALTGSGNVGVGTTSPNSTFHVDGSVATKVRNVSVAAANYIVQADDSVISVTAGGAFEVQLPSAAGITGREYSVFNGAAVAVVVRGNFKTSIGSTPTTSVPSDGGLRVVSDGTYWLRF